MREIARTLGRIREREEGRETVWREAGGDDGGLLGGRMIKMEVWCRVMEKKEGDLDGRSSRMEGEKEDREDGVSNEVGDKDGGGRLRFEAREDGMEV